MKQQTEEAGWKKVAANIKIKQGEQSSKKDINRMREAIIRKKDDPPIWCIIMIILKKVEYVKILFVSS